MDGRPMAARGLVPVLAAFLLGGCEASAPTDPVQADVGSVRVTTTTTGSMPGLDPDGYTVAVEGVGRRAIAPNATRTFTDVDAGDHDVVLTGLAPNCEVAGSNPRRVTVVAGSTVAVGFEVACDVPELSLDGERLIAFSRFREDDSWWGLTTDIWVVAADGDDPVRVLLDAGNPAWSPDGTRLAFEYANDVWILETDGSDATRLTRHPEFEGHPSWSPDGTRIAFTGHRTGRPELWVMDVDGANPVLLTTSSEFYGHPAWSPEGTRIAFTGGSDRERDVWVVDADGSNLERLTDAPGYDRHPAWSPDGTRIAFASDRSGNGDIWVMNADGSDPERLTVDSAYDGDPAWSPDGTRLAFSSTRGGNRDVWVVAADGTGAVQLTHASDDELDPAWSP